MIRRWSALQRIWTAQAAHTTAVRRIVPCAALPCAPLRCFSSSRPVIPPPPPQPAASVAPLPPSHSSLDTAPRTPTDVLPDDIEEPDASRIDHAHAREPGAGADALTEVPVQGVDLSTVAAVIPAPALFTPEELAALIADLKQWLADNPAAVADATATAAKPASTAAQSTHPTRPFLASWSVKEVCSWFLQVEEQLHPRPADASTSLPSSAASPGSSFVKLLVSHRIDGARLLCFTSDPALIPWVSPPLLSRILYLRGLDTYSHMFSVPSDDPSAAPADPSMVHLQRILGSTVKIFCTSTAPDFARPWAQQDQVDSTSSGFAIAGRRILGNAHGATYASQLRVRKHGDARKYKAVVSAISHEADLVLLEVPDPAFWDGLTPLSFGHVPRLQDTVIVVGYPTGGDSICVTKGVVSRVLVSNYVHSDEALLSVQIDAAINGGNSGGPVLLNGAVVGVAFQGSSNLQSVGFIIPVPVIQHFLTDIALHGRYTGYPSFFGIAFQKLENHSIKRFHGLSNGADGATSKLLESSTAANTDVGSAEEPETGVVVTEVSALEDAARVLQKGDVLTHIDGIPLADDGSIFFRAGERISMRYLPSAKFVGDSIRVRIRRAGQPKPIEVSFTLGPKRALVPTHLYDTPPSYFILGGLVFTILSRPYLTDTFGRSWAKRSPVDLVRTAYYSPLLHADQQVVILSTILADDVNTGYGSSFFNIELVAVNGVAVRNLRQMVDTCEAERANQAQFLRFDFTLNRVIVLDTKEAFAATESVLSQNSIEFDRSVDLRPQQQDATAEKTEDASIEDASESNPTPRAQKSSPQSPSDSASSAPASSSSAASGFRPWSPLHLLVLSFLGGSFVLSTLQSFGVDLRLSRSSSPPAASSSSSSVVSPPATH